MQSFQRGLPRNEPSISLSDKAFQEVGFIGYFAASAAPSIALVDQALHLWRVKVPAAADNHPFLAHGLSSLAALHIARRRPLDLNHYQLLARQFYDDGIKLFRTTVWSLDEDNSMSVFAFILAVIMFQFETSRQNTVPGSPMTQSFDPMEVFNPIRSAATMSRRLYPLLVQKRVIPLAGVGKYPQDMINDGTIRALDALEFLSLAQEEDPDSRAICVDATLQLIELIRMLIVRPRVWLQLCWWPEAVSTEFVALLQQRHPNAMLVYLGWCIIVQHAYRRWFFVQGYANEVYQYTKDALGSKWTDEIQRILTELDTGLKVAFSM
jgi:hypothetical protein